MVTVSDWLIIPKELKDLQEAIYLISDKYYTKLLENTSSIMHIKEYSTIFKTADQSSSNSTGSPFNYGVVSARREDCFITECPIV